MATQTSNLGLTKPAGTDFVQVSDFNGNSDTVDRAIGKLSELRTNVKSSLVEAINEAMISGGTDSPYVNKTNGHWMQWNNTLLKFEDTGVVASGSMWYNGTNITGTSAAPSVFETGISLAHVGDMYLNTQSANVYWCAKEGNASTATWRYLCNIKGLTGDPGPIGPTGTTFTPSVNSQTGIISWSNDGGKTNPPSVNIKGPKGDPGVGLDIRGTYATLSDLQSAVTSPQQGWMYNVGTQAPYRVYMYDSSAGWLDQGQLQGPTGSTGKSAYLAAVEGGYVGNEETFNAQMAEMPTHITDTNNPHSVNKSQIGLGKVDNTSDLEKPVSNAQSAINQQILTDLQNKQPLLTPGDNISISGSVIATKAFPCNPNLLDNWYFGNPVNQRGQTSYTSVGYGIDRWRKSSANTTVAVVTGGISVSGKKFQRLEQRVEDAQSLNGITVTFSALVKNPDGPFRINLYNETTDVSIVQDIQASEDFQLVQITAAPVINAGDIFSAALYPGANDATTERTCLIKAVKLELGSQQTLAHQENGKWVLNEIPDYGEQLRRCQRYFVNFNPYKMAWFSMPPAVTGVVSTGEAKAFSNVTLPVAMRAQPVVSYGGKIYLSQGDDVQVTDIQVSSGTFAGNYLQLMYITAGGLTENSLYRVQGGNDTTSYIWLSADL